MKFIFSTRSAWLYLFLCGVKCFDMKLLMIPSISFHLTLWAQLACVFVYLLRKILWNQWCPVIFIFFCISSQPNQRLNIWTLSQNHFKTLWHLPSSLSLFTDSSPCSNKGNHAYIQCFKEESGVPGRVRNNNTGIPRTGP